MRLVASVVLGALLLIAYPSAASSPPAKDSSAAASNASSEVDWDPRWRKFGTANYVFTGVGYAVGTLGLLIEPSPGRVSGVNALDEWARNEHSYDSGLWARHTSDALLVASIAFPLVVDPLLAAYHRKKPETAWQLALITAETLSANLMLQTPTAGLVSRERPYAHECGVTLDADQKECTANNRYRSFYSGHTSATFTMAMTTCSHHLRHELLGGPWDGISCGASVAVASATASLRVVGNRHYLTDVLTGAAVGSVTGLLVPWLFHYRTEGSETSVSLVPTGTGVLLSASY